MSTSDNEEVLYSRRSLGQTFFNNRGRMTRRGRRSTNWSRGRRSRGSGTTSKNVRGRSRFLNPKDVDGNILRCNICDSIYHFAQSCPEGWENINKVNEDGDAWDVHLLVGDQQAFMCKTVNDAVLDSACTKTVTGRAWRDTYVESLSNEERSQIKILLGGTVFRFGGEMKKESSEKLILPCTIAGRKVMIQTDVVNSDIPLQLSKPDMERLGLQVNMENDTAKIFDKVIDLGTTPSGHYFIPIRDCDVHIEDVHFAIEGKSYEDKKRIVQKLHRQFAHPSARNLKALMKNADPVDNEVNEIIDQISDNYNVCKRFKKTPARLVVCMPLATKFNQVIAMDLKHFKNGAYFLHLILYIMQVSLLIIYIMKWQLISM